MSSSALDIAEARAVAAAAPSPSRAEPSLVDPATGYVDADEMDAFRIELAGRLDRLRAYYEGQEREAAAARAGPGDAGS